MGNERYHPLVAVELRDACLRYDAISPALGNRFRASVQARLEAIVQRPESLGTIVGEFRGALVDRFPYVVVFAVENGVPCIYGVRHAASDRKSWFDRTMRQKDG